MRLLLAADWAGPRLMGLGLLGAAWMLWTLGDGPDARVADLGHGMPPMVATGLYAAFGFVLALPFLMTGRLAHPRHIAGGIIKATLLLGAAFLLVGPLRLTIFAVVPEVHQPLGLAILPPLFKALAGLAAASALALASLRQRGTDPERALKDGTAVMNATTLRNLRRARMQV